MLRIACLLASMLLLAACGLRLDVRGPGPGAEFSRDHPLLVEPVARLEVAQLAAPRVRLAPAATGGPDGSTWATHPTTATNALPAAVEARPLPPLPPAVVASEPQTRVIVPQARASAVPQARASAAPPPLRPFPSLWPRPGEPGGAAVPAPRPPAPPPVLLVPPSAPIAVPAAPAAALGGTTIFVDGRGARPVKWQPAAPIQAVAVAAITPPPAVSMGTWVVDGRGARLETWSDERGQQRAQPVWQEAVLRDTPGGTAALVAGAETRHRHDVVPPARGDVVPLARMDVVPVAVAAAPLERPQREPRRIAFAALSAAVPLGADLGADTLGPAAAVEVTGLADTRRGLAPAAAERLAMNRAVAVRRALVAAGVASERIRLAARVADDDAVLLRAAPVMPPLRVTAAGRPI